jgi:hypothetical protein
MVQLDRARKGTERRYQLASWQYAQGCVEYRGMRLWKSGIGDVAWLLPWNVKDHGKFRYSILIPPHAFGPRPMQDVDFGETITLRFERNLGEVIFRSDD